MTQDPKKLRVVPSLHEIRSGLWHAGHLSSNLVLSSSYHLSSGGTDALPDHLAAVAKMGTSAISLKGDLAFIGKHLRGDHGAAHHLQVTGTMSRSQLNRSARERLSAPKTRAVSLLRGACGAVGVRRRIQGMCDLARIQRVS